MGMMNIMFAICILTISSVFVVSAKAEERKTFIVYMGSLAEGEKSHSSHHSKMVKKIVDQSFASKALIRSYKNFNGFAAYLSEEEKNNLARFNGIVSVLPNRKYQLQTTESWEFMGFSDTTERNPYGEGDITIGFIDTGIWPESESFNDAGFGPIPSKWKGVCDGGKDFTCNRKIIGARSYIIENSERSARDTKGHGTHVASIAAGNRVKDASYYGIAQGTATGGVPSARIAVYKVCGDYYAPDCHTTEILAAFDDAISDGVDIISISINPDKPTEPTSNPIEIGALHAIERDILTINSAGNNKGPDLFSVTSSVPWILTVAASDTNRKIVDKIMLGNNAILVGNGINAFPSSDVQLSIVYAKEVTIDCSEADARKCLPTCLESSLIKQKVVMCDNDRYIKEVKIAGAVGCIVPNYGRNVSYIMPYPVVGLTANALSLVKTYMNSTTVPQVQILKSEAMYNQSAPSVASFSCRGPVFSFLSQCGRFMSHIIKPDITAPGVEILAAFSPMASPSNTTIDKRSLKFNILSGTSMACPHVSGAAAFVKSYHPTWSASAIKSSLMTTAWEIDGDLDSGAEFSYGSGHVDPLKAVNPGLVYETSIQEYLSIWCNMSGTGIASCRNQSMTTLKDINYPSMAIQLDMKEHAFTASFPRAVTNVGQANSTYIAYIGGDRSKLHVTVEPSSLQFTELNQKMSFRVIVKGKRFDPFTLKRVSLMWSDGIHKVRSPIVLYTVGSPSSRNQVPTPSSGIYIAFVVLVAVLLF